MNDSFLYHASDIDDIHCMSNVYKGDSAIITIEPRERLCPLSELRRHNPGQERHQNQKLHRSSNHKEEDSLPLRAPEIQMQGHGLRIRLLFT